MTEELNYSLIDLLNPVWKIAAHYHVHPSNMVDVFNGFYRLTDYVSKIEQENVKLKKENTNLKKLLIDRDSEIYTRKYARLHQPGYTEPPLDNKSILQALQQLDLRD